MAIASINTNGQEQWGKAGSAFTGQLSTKNPAVNALAYCWYENNRTQSGAMSICLLRKTKILYQMLWSVFKMKGCFPMGLIGKCVTCYTQPVKLFPSCSTHPRTYQTHTTQIKQKQKTKPRNNLLDSFIRVQSSASFLTDYCNHKLIALKPWQPMFKLIEREIKDLWRI